MNKGRIVQVMGPVVDVVFENGDLPFIKDALEVENNGKKCIMEVAQHLGNNEVRCLMLAASEGLCKDMEVTATGAGIQVPVGEQTLGRLFNVLGETIDNGEPITDSKKWVIHREPPTFEEQSPVVEILETGIKVIDLLAPYAKGAPVEKLMPPNGVYITVSHFRDRSYQGITNVGHKPTVGGEKFIGVETYLFDCNEDLYGEYCKVDFKKFLRPEQKFSSLEALKAQLERDAVKGQEYFETL